MSGLRRCRAGALRNLNSLALALAAVFVIVPRGLQRDAQQHVLHHLQHDARHAGAVGDEVGEVGEIDNARHRDTRAFGPDRRDQQFRLGERQAADPVDLLGDDHLAGLQVGAPP